MVIPINCLSDDIIKSSKPIRRKYHLIITYINKIYTQC